MHRLQELVRLHRLGRTAREVARMLGMGRNTLAAYAKALARLMHEPRESRGPGGVLDSISSSQVLTGALRHRFRACSSTSSRCPPPGRSVVARAGASAVPGACLLHDSGDSSARFVHKAG
jgi:hypothetical protein